MRFFDPDLLRTFIAFAEAGTLSRAAEIVGRSPSAVTAQMQRLEDLVGEPLLIASGRRRVLSPAGQEFTRHARQILAANRDAWLSVKGNQASGQIVLGATQDLAETALPSLLRRFAETHPRVKLDLRIGRSGELIHALQDGRADVAVVLRSPDSIAPADEIGHHREAMTWIGATQGLAVHAEELPLALLDPPCGFRDAALAALEAQNRPYRIAATSGSLSGLRAAVGAGIAVTLRTARMIGPGLSDISQRLSLPTVPDALFSIRLGTTASAAAEDLSNWIATVLQELGNTIDA